MQSGGRENSGFVMSWTAIGVQMTQSHTMSDTVTHESWDTADTVAHKRLTHLPTRLPWNVVNDRKLRAKSHAYKQ